MAKISYGELLEPYTFRRDFDYWKHLENRSHFDLMSDRVEQSIVKLGLSQAEIAELTSTRMGEQMREVAGAISAGQDRVADELRSGFRDIGDRIDRVTDSVDRMRDSVDQVRDSVDEVRFAIENGFRLTERRLASIEHVLTDLLEAVRSPERTWALEQYATARDLYRREYYRDALQYLDLSINGKGSNTGYRFDAQFHLLRGTILLGDRENLDRALIDPRAAKAAFEEAVKYAKPPRDMLDAANEARRVELLQPRCFALCCSGWGSYVVGDMAEAERCYRAAVQDCPEDARANYHLGKVLAHQGRHEEAAKHVAKAIRRNFYLIAQLEADADFKKDTGRYLHEVERYRNELLDALTPVAEALLLASSEGRGFALDGNGEPLGVFPGSEFTGKFGNIAVNPAIIQYSRLIASRSTEIGTIVRTLPDLLSVVLRLVTAFAINEQSFEADVDDAEHMLQKMPAPTYESVGYNSAAVDKVKEIQQMTGYGAAVLSAGGWIFVDDFGVLTLLLSLGYAILGAPLVAGMYEGNLRSSNLRKAKAEWENNRGGIKVRAQRTTQELESLRALRSKLENALAAPFLQDQLNDGQVQSIEGRIFEGVVISIHPFGVMVRFNGNDEGLVHISQISDAHIKNPSEVTAVGRRVRVMALGFDDRGKVRLSMKVCDQLNEKARP